ncbi:MAG: hypothetical protein FWG74_01675, partial [Planctomycetes bacterium]|nr:hypothetical protein [Planctomycetota bacterium]
GAPQGTGDQISGGGGHSPPPSQHHQVKHQETVMTDTACRNARDMTVSPEDALRRLVAWLKENDARVKPYFHYSGRFMFGSECFGLVGAIIAIQAALLDFRDDHPDTGPAIKKLVKRHRTDQMGLDMIYYFPGVDIEDDGEDDEEADGDSGRRRAAEPKYDPAEPYGMCEPCEI